MFVFHHERAKDYPPLFVKYLNTSIPANCALDNLEVTTELPELLKFVRNPGLKARFPAEISYEPYRVRYLTRQPRLYEGTLPIYQTAWREKKKKEKRENSGTSAGQVTYLQIDRNIRRIFFVRFSCGPGSSNRFARGFSRALIVRQLLKWTPLSAGDSRDRSRSVCRPAGQPQRWNKIHRLP